MKGQIVYNQQYNRYGQILSIIENTILIQWENGFSTHGLEHRINSNIPDIVIILPFFECKILE